MTIIKETNKIVEASFRLPDEKMAYAVFQAMMQQGMSRDEAVLAVRGTSGLPVVDIKQSFNRWVKTIKF